MSIMLGTSLSICFPCLLFPGLCDSSLTTVPCCLLLLPCVGTPLLPASGVPSPTATLFQSTKPVPSNAPSTGELLSVRERSINYRYTTTCSIGRLIPKRSGTLLFMTWQSKEEHTMWSSTVSHPISILFSLSPTFPSVSSPFSTWFIIARVFIVKCVFPFWECLFHSSLGTPVRCGAHFFLELI